MESEENFNEANINSEIIDRDKITLVEEKSDLAKSEPEIPEVKFNLESGEVGVTESPSAARSSPVTITIEAEPKPSKDHPDLSRTEARTSLRDKSEQTRKQVHGQNEGEINSAITSDASRTSSGQSKSAHSKRTRKTHGKSDKNPSTNTVGSDQPSSNTLRRRHEIDRFHSKYPHCLVWTPIPVLTWFFPLIGHFGIAQENGKILDFEEPYVVAEDKMTFGKPTKYWQIDLQKIAGRWDRAVQEAVQEYKVKYHNGITDNSLSMVVLALNLMHYKGSTSWNGICVAAVFLIYSKYTGVGGFFRSWGPFLVLIATVAAISYTYLSFAAPSNARSPKNSSSNTSKLP